MGIKDILAKARSVQCKANATIRSTQSKVVEHQVKANADRAKREAVEAKRLDSRLSELEAQEKRLRHKDASQSAIRAKQKRIAELEAKVTIKGRVLNSLNKSAASLLKSAKKEERKAKQKTYDKRERIAARKLRRK